MCTQLHERLKQARERRRISLASIARQWGIREQNLELIERDGSRNYRPGSTAALRSAPMPPQSGYPPTRC